MNEEIIYEIRMCIQCGRVLLMLEIERNNKCPTCGGFTDEHAEITHSEIIEKLGLPDWRP
jgi:predicted RNA-binding Zn-ribbon protein involved in translation (DUF1610 family)